MPPAIIDITSSGVPLSKRTWGGKRNSASRTSDTLSKRDADKLIAAAQYAWKIGLPLNRHITIHWEQAGILDCHALAATSRFLRRASQWIAKRGGQFAYVWVREQGEGKGSHVHILAHVPANLSLGGMQLRWLRLSRTSHMSLALSARRELVGTCVASESAPLWYLANLAEVLGYQLKGTSLAVSQTLGLTRRPQHG